MFSSLFVHPYTRELRENAELLKPGEQTHQRMIEGIAVATGAAVSVSVSVAILKGLQAARAAFVKTAASIAVTTVGVSVIGVAGVSMILPPAIEDVYVQTQDWHAATIVVDTSSVMPPQSVTAGLPDGSAWLASHIGGGTYTVTVPQNGTYEVQVTGQGGQTVDGLVQVQGLDDGIPLLQRYEIEGERVRLYFTDDGSGVDWDSIAAVGADGAPLAPLALNQTAGYVVFALTQPQLNVLVQDLAGNRAVCTVSVS